MLVRAALSLIFLVAGLFSGPACAHDPSAWGGMYRSRDNGATWLPADAGLFIGGALALAVHPHDANHLLYGTDTRLLRSGNGGRDWRPEFSAATSEAVFAVAFDPDGKQALVSTGSRILHTTDGTHWQPVAAPGGAAPARAFVSSATAGLTYLAGAHGLFVSEDHGRTWSRSGEGTLPDSPVRSLIARGEQIYAVIDGSIWVSADGARTWQMRNAELPVGRIQVLSADPSTVGQFWCVAADQVFFSDDAGESWKRHGGVLPEANTSVRGIAVAESGKTVTLTTHRGVLRSVDGGEKWVQIESTLPVHLEAGPLIRDPHDAATLYAGFSLAPYSEVWRRAEQGVSLLDKLDMVSLAGGGAFLALLLIGGTCAARWLSKPSRAPNAEFSNQRNL